MPLIPLILLAACAHPALPEPVAKPGGRLVEQVPMDDGVRLHTQVFLPRGEGPWPVVSLRTPYPMETVLRPRCRFLNRHGYACVFQDARGRGESGGEWLPFEHEPADGRAAVDWIADQPWCDGHIAMMGESYLGASAWGVAHDPPEALKTIVPIVIGTALHEASYEGGMFRHDILTAWMALMPATHTFRYLSGSRHYHRALRRRPRIEMDEAAWGAPIPWFEAWLAAPDPADPFWHRPVVERARETPEVTPLPVLSIGGWSDVFLGPQMVTWERLGTKADSHWIIGPWNHLSRVPAAVPQPGFVTDIHARRYQQWPILLDWLGHHLKGEPLDVPAGRVSSWPVNGDGWVSRATWPPETVDRTWRLASAEGAATCRGRLTGGPAGSGTVSFLYDPADPTPARGGAGVLAGVLPLWRGPRAGFLDQGALCDRRDDLVGFVSRPLAEDLHVAGALRATVEIATTAEDTAVNVRYLEQRPDGRRIHVRETIVALSHRDGHGDAPVTPGEPVAVDLETWPVEYVFEAGSRLLVQIASASYPKYEAHPNVAGPWAEVPTTRPSEQTLHLGGTSVSLPVWTPAPGGTPDAPGGAR